MRPVLIAKILPGMAILNSPPQALIGVPYSFTFQVVGGTAPYTFVLISPTLTDGWAFNGTTGVLSNSGGPTVPGGFTMHVYVRDSTFDYEIIDQAFVVDIIALPLTLSGHLPDQTNGVAITPYTYTASGGFGGYSYAITAGALPTGLSLNPATGQVAGTPTSNGSFAWTLTVTDSSSGTASIPDSCAVSAPSLSLTGTATSPVTIGSAYSWTPTTTGGAGPYTYSVGSGSLPAGTTLNTSTGNVSGTVTTVASSTFVIHVVDSASNSANSPSETIVVNADPVALSIYNKIANAAGGDGAYWDIKETGTSGFGIIRADQANGNDLGLVGTVSIVNGPRGAGDNATNASSGAGYLYRSRVVNDSLDVPVAPNQKYCLFGFVKFNSTAPTANIGGTYQGGSPPNGGCLLIEVGTGISGYSGDSVSGGWCHADTTIPDTTNWHFYATWRDNTDGKMRIAIDGGTPAASSNTCAPSQNNINFNLLTGSGSPEAAVSRWGWIKGDYLTGTEQTWMVNSGNGRNWAEIKTLAGH